MEYLGEHLLPGKIGHFFSVLSFAASFVALIAYFKATNAKTPEEERSWRRMARTAYLIDVVAVFSVLLTIIYIINARLFEAGRLRPNTCLPVSGKRRKAVFFCGPSGTAYSG
jgi:cytochrome c-type biogenesis protein CcmF